MMGGSIWCRTCATVDRSANGGRVHEVACLRAHRRVCIETCVPDSGGELTDLEVAIPSNLCLEVQRTVLRVRVIHLGTFATPLAEVVQDARDRNQAAREVVGGGNVEAAGQDRVERLITGSAGIVSNRKNGSDSRERIEIWCGGGGGISSLGGPAFPSSPVFAFGLIVTYEENNVR